MLCSLYIKSGATGVACINLNRRFVGCEIDEIYFRIVNERIAGVLNDKKNERT